MGGSSGLQILNDLNPFYAGGTVNNAVESDEAHTLAAGAAVLGGGYLAGSALGIFGAEAATTAAAEGTGYLGAELGATAVESGAAGVGYLGAETTISGTGAAAAQLGGTGASTELAISHAGGYLGVDTSFGGVAPGVGSAVAASTPWYSSLIPSGATALGLANTYLNASRPSGGTPTASAPALRMPSGYLSSPSGPGSTISIGGMGQAAPTPAQAAQSKLIVYGIGALALLYFAKKKGAI